mgnify:CR=1 FL=1
MRIGERREQLMGGEGKKFGKDFEIDLFGLPRVDDPKYREELERVKDKQSGYVPFREALGLVSKIQPRKYRPFSIKLTHEIARALGQNKNPDINDSRIRFYTTVDTPLDTFHGADAIIEVRREGKEPIQIRLGATMADEYTKDNRQSKKSDVEIEASWLNLEDEEALDKEKIPELAARVISQLEEKVMPKEPA